MFFFLDTVAAPSSNNDWNHPEQLLMICLVALVHRILSVTAVAASLTVSKILIFKSHLDPFVYAYLTHLHEVMIRHAHTRIKQYSHTRMIVRVNCSDSYKLTLHFDSSHLLTSSFQSKQFEAITATNIFMSPVTSLNDDVTAMLISYEITSVGNMT